MDPVERVAWVCLLNKARQRRRRRIVRRAWVHDINQRRLEFGEFHHLLQELRQDESRFQQYFRLTCAQFDDLLARIGAPHNLPGHQLQALDSSQRAPVHLFAVSQSNKLPDIKHISLSNLCVTLITIKLKLKLYEI